jgi:ADP-heptose:LPS heptosyltransferase
VGLLTKAFKNLVIRIIPSLGSKNQSTLNSPKLIVLVNWENLGDFVLFTAVIREMKLNFPEAKLFVVAQRENKELSEHCPYVEKWIWIRGHKKTKTGMGHGFETSYWEKFIVTYMALLIHGRKKIDLMLGPDWLLVKNQEQFSSNLLFQKANRGAAQLKEVGFKNREMFKDKSHQVTRMLSILEMFGLQVNSDEIENWIAPVLSIENKGIKDSKSIRPRRILVSLGAGQVRRNWPIENVKQLIDSLEVNYPSFQIVVMGPKSLVTPKINQTFTDSGNVINLIGKTNLSTVASLMQNSDLLISNDSGLAHIAASVKLTCIVVSAHSLNGDPWHLHSPNRYHPWKTEYLVIQPPLLLGECLGSCQATYPHCIKAITPNRVLDACKLMLTHILP